MLLHELVILKTWHRPFHAWKYRLQLLHSYRVHKHPSEQWHSKRNSSRNTKIGHRTWFANDLIISSNLVSKVYSAISTTLILDHYGMVTSLKSYGKRVILGLGGWADSTPKYSQMLKHHKLRTMLVSQIADYVIKYEFDGLDVRINYPGAYQVRILVFATNPQNRC